MCSLGPIFPHGFYFYLLYFAVLYCTLLYRVERDGYATLEALGATKLAKVDTAGGGAANPVWTAMRQRLLNVPTGDRRPWCRSFESVGNEIRFARTVPR